MKCVVCGRFWLKPICKQCLFEIKITPSVRVIEGISVYSFYAYSEVAMLMKSKYYIFGSRILHILALKASDYFFDSQQNPSFWKTANFYGVGVDDVIKSAYSHTAVILRAFCRYGFKPAYGKLKATNAVQYAGKTLGYRQQNPKKFVFDMPSPKDGSKNLLEDIFIVDDIITTGTTMSEAIKTIESTGRNVRFCIALCDARN
ncbi:ComF family protein [Helicobacter sp. 11S02596-1]|uniref:ComF family protein n=1 Tax=Helicobacter sp. 11S02596-1 TaxID=1476194 RepID=UPI000BA54B79|nr:ComF family protein [Helicobacter sp. 11S02596-1]PAF42475.1 hypothetical protein BJI48_06655 [Helicobacter sp. 11S02596-1]